MRQRLGKEFLNRVQKGKAQAIDEDPLSIEVLLKQDVELLRLRLKRGFSQLIEA